MPQGVLPSSRVLSVVRETIGDKLVDLGERQHLVPRRPYRHRRQRYVGVGRFLITVGIARGPRHRRDKRRDERWTEEQSLWLAASDSGTCRSYAPTLDTSHDVRRYSSRANILQRILANRHEEHEVGSGSRVLGPRAETEISIGSNHGDPRPAEASEVRPCVVRAVSRGRAYVAIRTISTTLPSSSSTRVHREAPRIDRTHVQTHRIPATRDRVSADTAADPYPHPRNGLPLPASPRLHRVPDWSLPDVRRVLDRSRSRYRRSSPSNRARWLSHPENSRAMREKGGPRPSLAFRPDSSGKAGLFRASTASNEVPPSNEREQPSRIGQSDRVRPLAHRRPDARTPPLASVRWPASARRTRGNSLFVLSRSNDTRRVSTGVIFRLNLILEMFFIKTVEGAFFEDSGVNNSLIYSMLLLIILKWIYEIIEWEEVEKKM